MHAHRRLGGTLGDVGRPAPPSRPGLVLVCCQMEDATTPSEQTSTKWGALSTSVITPSSATGEETEDGHGLSKWEAFHTSPTLRLAVRRLLIAIPVLIGVTFATAVMLDLLPGDAASALLGANATPQEIHQLSVKLHLYEPFYVRYWQWLDGVFHGNLGRSLGTNFPVAHLISEKIPVTFELVVTSVIVMLLVSIPLAMFCARRPGGIVDRVTMLLSMGFLSVPQFVLGLLFVLVFAVIFNVFPALGYVPITQSLGANLRDYTLPALTIALPSAGFYVRLLRADLVEQMETQDYIVTARAKGFGSWYILTRHAFKNSLISFLTILGLNVATLFGYTVIVEEIFGLPGLGKQLITSVGTRDAPLIQGIVLVLAGIVVIVNLLTDLMYGVIDPRVRYGRSAV
ncbi:MAG: ABC transporter permease [Acidimicrobiales bacterium]